MSLEALVSIHVWRCYCGEPEHLLSVYLLWQLTSRSPPSREPSELWTNRGSFDWEPRRSFYRRTVWAALCHASSWPPDLSIITSVMFPPQPLFKICDLVAIMHFCNSTLPVRYVWKKSVNVSHCLKVLLSPCMSLPMSKTLNSVSPLLITFWLL